MKAGWKRKRLAEVCTLQRGFDLPTKDRKSGKVPLVSSSGVVDHIDRSKVEGPGVVTGRSGSIGNVFFVEEDFWPLNTALYVKDFFGNDARFVFLLLKSLDLVRFASGSGVPTLNRNHVSDEIVFVPECVIEQRRIVAVVDEALAAIATATGNAEKNLANARALFEACSANLFRSAGPEWKSLPLCAVSDFQGGSQPPKSTFVSEPRANYVRLLQIRDFKSDKAAVYIPESKRNKLCRADDVMIARYGASVGQIHRGKAGAYNVALIRTIPDLEIVDLDYLYYFLKSPLFQIPLMTVASRSAQDGFGKDDIARINVPVPPLAVQKLIISELMLVHQECQSLAALSNKKIETLTNLKQSILDRAFAGELAERKTEGLAA